jgi:hypothetical protein
VNSLVVLILFSYIHQVNYAVLNQRAAVEWSNNHTSFAFPFRRWREKASMGCLNGYRISKSFQGSAGSRRGRVVGSFADCGEGSSAEEFQEVKRSIGHMIADVDVLLHRSIYADHPELNHLKGQR